MEPKKRSKTNVSQGFLLLLLLSVIAYLLVRSVSLAFLSANRIDKVMGIIFIMCEAFVILHGLGYCWSLFSINVSPSNVASPAQLTDYPSVAVLVPARDEPRDVLENTLACLHNLDYPNKAIYLLDDSSDDAHHRDADELTEKFGAKVFRREKRHGAKAGIINDCVATLDAKYVAVFDADQNPIASFLSALVPLMEADDKLAFVQTPQFYSNANESSVSLASNVHQGVFYDYVCEAKSSRDAMMCCGTNVVFRRSALEDVGGLDESTVTEDFATSVEFHARGWKTLYYNHVNTFGAGPQNLAEYFKQQNRWATGNVSVLRSLLLRLVTRPASLSLTRWFDYLLTSSYYLVGWAYLFLLAFPILLVLFDVPSFFLRPSIYTLTFMPYLILSHAVFYQSMGDRGWSLRDLFKGQLLLMLSLPIYMKASLLGLLGIRGTFEVTGKTGDRHVPYRSLWPQLTLFAISIVGATWGANRLFYERSVPILLNLAWITYHLLLFSSVFYFNEERPDPKTIPASASV